MDMDGDPIRVQEDTEVVGVEAVAAEQEVDIEEAAKDIEEGVVAEESPSANFLVRYWAVFMTQPVHSITSKCFFYVPTHVVKHVLLVC